MSLSLSDQKHFEYARGWIGLGSWLEANTELDNIAPEMRGHPKVLRMRFVIYHRLQRWPLVYELGRALSAADVVTGDDLFIFARAACRVGKLRDAFDAIQRAIDRAEGDKKKNYRLAALDDPDFKPLWVDISEI
jgi:uncharacterized protein HemY